MSQHTYYQAFPEGCHLFQRLRRDRAFRMLYTQFIVLGPGPFFLSRLAPSEVSDVLDWLGRQEPAMTSHGQAERLLGELRAEVERTTASYPGIERRTAYFEQVQEEVEELLVAQFTRRGHKSAAALADCLLHGETALGSDPQAAGYLQLFVVSAGTVRAGALALRAVPPSVFERASGEWDLDTEAYTEWRKLYLESAKRGDVIGVLNA